LLNVSGKGTGGCWGEVGRLRRGGRPRGRWVGNGRAARGRREGGCRGGDRGAMKGGESWFGCGNGDPRTKAKSLIAHPYDITHTFLYSRTRR